MAAAIVHVGSYHRLGLRISLSTLDASRKKSPLLVHKRYQFWAQPDLLRCNSQGRGKSQVQWKMFRSGWAARCDRRCLNVASELLGSDMPADSHHGSRMADRSPATRAQVKKRHWKRLDNYMRGGGAPLMRTYMPSPNAVLGARVN